VSGRRLDDCEGAYERLRCPEVAIEKNEESVDVGEAGGEISSMIDTDDPA
jgi:hypothetical protein